MIINVDLNETMKRSFMLYAEEVAINRSIPDVRDGLKLGLRQGLYAQYSNKLTHKDKFQKAQKSVANAMAQSYVHGDAAMYDTFIRAAKPWVYRYPLEEAQGAYGSPCAPDDQSAARYVEMRSSEISDYFFSGLKKNTIEHWYNNYDDTEKIPSVFPSIGFWNIVNGCSGIAVGFTTSINPTNLKEVNNAIVKLIQNPETDFDEIICYPDYPSGATLINKREVYESLKNGYGKAAKMRATLAYDPTNNYIMCTNIPYGVFVNTIMGELAQLTEENPNYGIDRVIDHTKKEADIRIYLSKNVNPKRMIDKLYKDTSLQSFFSINMVMLDKGRYPKVFGWREALLAYIDHAKECKRKEYEFDKRKAEARKNIVDGMILAIANIDEVVRIIRSSETQYVAQIELIKKFGFNEEQVKAILELKLQRLVNMESIKFEKERENLILQLQELENILTNNDIFNQKLIDVFNEVTKKFGDARRTTILNLNDETEEKEELPAINISVMLTDKNNIYVTGQEEIKGAQKGRKGSKLKLPKGETIIDTINTTDKDDLYAFSDSGKMWSIPISSLELNAATPVSSICNSEKVIKFLRGEDFEYYKYLIFITKNGVIKKSKTDLYKIRGTKGSQAIKLKDGDSIVSAFLSAKDSDIITIVTRNGQYVRYTHEDISATGKITQGVKAISLRENDYVVAATIQYEGIEYLGLLTVNNSGRGKLTKIDEFNFSARTNKGNLVQKLDEGEYINAAFLVRDNHKVINFISNNAVVSIPIEKIPISSRTTMGNSLIKATNTILISAA